MTYVTYSQRWRPQKMAEASHASNKSYKASNLYIQINEKNADRPLPLTFASLSLSDANYPRQLTHAQDGSVLFGLAIGPGTQFKFKADREGQLLIRIAQIHSTHARVVLGSQHHSSLPWFLAPLPPFFRSAAAYISRTQADVYISGESLAVNCNHTQTTQFVFMVRSGIVFSSYDFYLQAIFASSIPEIIELVGSRSKYSGEYKREHGKRYYYKITSFNPVFFVY